MARHSYSFQDLCEIKDKVLSAGPPRSAARTNAIMRYALSNDRSQGAVQQVVGILQGKDRGERMSYITADEWAYLTGNGPNPRLLASPTPPPPTHEFSETIAQDILAEILAMHHDLRSIDQTLKALLAAWTNTITEAE